MDSCCRVAADLGRSVGHALHCLPTPQALPLAQHGRVATAKGLVHRQRPVANSYARLRQEVAQGGWYMGSESVQSRANVLAHPVAVVSMFSCAQLSRRAHCARQECLYQAH